MSSPQFGPPPATNERVVDVASESARGSAPAVRRAARPMLRVATRLFNPLLGRLAGRRNLPFFAVVHHQGRRSGRAYATPTNARRIADGFIVPLTFGEGADWYRNVLAAGGCVVEWNGVMYPLVGPEIIDRATAQSAFSPLERMLLPVIGIERFVRLRDAPVDGNREHTPSALSGVPQTQPFDSLAS